MGFKRTKKKVSKPVVKKKIIKKADPVKDQKLDKYIYSEEVEGKEKYDSPISDDKDKLMEKFKKNYQAKKAVMIYMELFNGDLSSFITNELGGSFVYDSRRYVFDPTVRYYNINKKLYCYDFNQSFALPIKRHFPIDLIQKTIIATGMVELDYATNPTTPARFMTSNVIEMILRGGDLAAYIKRILIIVAIALAVSVIHMFLFLQSSGMLEGIKIW
ncbi:MAG: hypothetical protein KAS07_05830 [Candidatus Pacebacteria bacterium]|nr:hypothetical protein [Candidatus Paceibacterota bacterium]